MISCNSFHGSEISPKVIADGETQCRRICGLSDGVRSRGRATGRKRFDRKRRRGGRGECRNRMQNHNVWVSAERDIKERGEGKAEVPAELPEEVVSDNFPAPHV